MVTDHGRVEVEAISTAHRSGPSSRATGSPWESSSESTVMPGRTMTPFRSPLTHGESAGETKSSVTRRLPTRSTNGRRVKARPAVAERIGARNGTGGAVLREIMRLGRNFWARRVWVDFRKVSC